MYTDRLWLMGIGGMLSRSFALPTGLTLMSSKGLSTKLRTKPAEPAAAGTASACGKAGLSCTRHQ